MSKQLRKKDKNPVIDPNFSEEMDPIATLVAPPKSKREKLKHNEATLKKDIQSERQEANQSKERMTIQINKATVERVKNAVYWTPGLTIAQLTEEALNQALDQLEKQRGSPFTQRKSELRPGRPLK